MNNFHGIHDLCVFLTKICTIRVIKLALDYPFFNEYSSWKHVF